MAERSQQKGRAMYVCLCNGVTDRQIRSCVAEGACSMKDLRECLGVGTRCGRCAPFAKSLLKEAAPSAAAPLELEAAAA